jgi:glycosyltransferase involved in cell wall biosynthesis
MWRKGYEYLLLAVRQVVDSGVDVVLEIADYDGPERERAEYTISELGLEDHVVILGKLPPEKVREALWRCDVFVLSALSEGISNAVIEAMACGVPVVTTDCGGMKEAVTDGIEGFVVPKRDPSSLADAIKKLASDPALRATMGMAGRKRVELDFLPVRQAREFIAVYRDILNAGSDGSIARLNGNAAFPKTSQGELKVDTNLTIERRVAAPPHVTTHIVTVADLHWRNGHEYALEAIKILLERDYSVRYTIVGTGPFLEATGFARYELGLMDIVEIILDESRAEEFLAAANMFLLAAVAGGADHALAQARERRIPAVCTDVTELSSICLDYPDCIVTPRRDKTALADAIAEHISARTAIVSSPSRTPN